MNANISLLKITDKNTSASNVINTPTDQSHQQRKTSQIHTDFAIMISINLCYY